MQEITKKIKKSQKKSKIEKKLKKNSYTFFGVIYP